MIKSIIQALFKTLSPVIPKLSAKVAVELLFRPRRGKRSEKEIKFWGKGRPVTFKSGCQGRAYGDGEKSVWVIHGWESRGSKMQAMVEKCLSLGYEVIVWEGPAHGDSPGKRSNLALSGRTLARDVASYPQMPESLIGHSFGAASAAYACRLGLSVSQLVFVSGPTSTLGFFQNYWDMIGLKPAAQEKFLRLVEAELKMDLDELSADRFIQLLNQDVLVIHDNNDSMIPVSDAKRLKEVHGDVELFITEKLGHHRIVRNAVVLDKIGQFIGEASPVKKSDKPRIDTVSAF